MTLKLNTFLTLKAGNKKTVETLIEHFAISFIKRYNTCYCLKEPLFTYDYFLWFNYFINFIAIFYLTSNISRCYDQMLFTYIN